MNGVNKVLLLGHLGGDPEIRRTERGAPVASFSVATSESWRDKATGERRESTEWHKVVVYNEALVKVAEQYLKKGSKVFVEGAMKTRKWTDRSGVERYTTEVVLVTFRGQIALLDRMERPPVADEASYGEAQRPAPAGAPGRAARDDMNDDIPF